jgi:putative DNA primase/helicase
MSHHQVVPLQSKPESYPVSCEYAGGRFILNEKGLSFIGSDKDGNPLPPRWICSSIKVVAKTRDAKSGEWGRLLEWRDDDSVTHQWGPCPWLCCKATAPMFGVNSLVWD